MAVPKKHWVEERYESMRKYYSTYHGQARAVDQMYRQAFDGILDVPYEVRIFKSATAANIVEGFRNQIRTNEPTVTYMAYGSSEKARKHATLLQKWGYGQLRREREMSVLDPNLQCGLDLLLRGAACKKIVVDTDKIVGKPPKRGSASYSDWESKSIRTWPYVSKAIDPLSLFPSPGTRKPLTFMIERQTRAAGEIEGSYPHWVNKDKKQDPTRLVEWLEYWTDDYYTVIADGNEVISKPNPYGFVPYIFEWSGLGKVHADGGPEHLGISILTHVLGELEEEVRLKTAISVQTQMHVFPPILTIEDPRKVARQFGVGPGKVIQHPPGHPPQYMQYPPPNENMFRMLDVIQGNISRVQSSALSGGRESGVHYGVLQAQMIGQALTTIAPVLTTLDTIGTRTLNMMADMARNMELHMAVEGTQEGTEGTYRVNPNDFNHDNFTVTFEAVDPAENDRALLVGESLRRAGDITQRTLWKKYAKHVVEDADEEEMGLLEEKILQQLVASGQLGMAVLDRDVQEQMMEQADEAVDNTREGIMPQNRRQESVPEVAAQQAQELETIAGRPGLHTIPRDVAEQGMAAATPSRTGLPTR